MLYGRLTYRDEHLGPVSIRTYANDNFDDTRLYFTNDSSDFEQYLAISTLFDKKIDEETGELTNPWQEKQPSDNRRLDVQKSNKFKTNVTNMEFCSRIAAIFRYMQISGRKNYNQFHTKEDEENFVSTRYVEVEGMGFIKYDYGLIVEIKIQSKYFDVHLQEIGESPFEDGVFGTLKKKDNFGNILSVTPIANVGFKLTESLLGFPYEEQIKKMPINMFGMFDTIEEVIDHHPDKKTEWILDRNYIIVTDDILEEVIAMFRNHKGYIAFDTETTGLSINFRSRTGDADQLVGVVLSIQKGTGYYFPLQHKQFANLCGGDHGYFMERYMRSILEKKRIICHNISFDWKVAYIYDIVVNCVYDTMIAFAITKGYEHKGYKIGLKQLVQKLFGYDMFDLDDFVRNGSFTDSGIDFSDLPYEIVRRYAPADADMTLALFEHIEVNAMLQEYEAERVFEMEVVFAKAVAYAEFWGYHTATEKIPQLRDTILGSMQTLEQKMFDMVGWEFNPESPADLVKAMYDKEQGLGIPPLSEKMSTDKEVLKTLSSIEENGEPKYPFATLLKSYRDASGINKNFLKKLHEFATPDGYIFSSVKQFGADTGRTSATKPNYQSYNDAVKKNIDPRPGYIHFDSDFSQIEYRVLASMAKQLNLISEFEDPDLDYHTYQASRMFSIPYALVTKERRAESKGINFGLPYGMGDSSLGLRIFGVRNKETQRKAGLLRKKFFEGQERIEEFFKKVRDDGVKKGYTSTYYGRRRYYHREFFNEAAIRRQAGNHVIQGTAADIYKKAVGRMFNRIIKEGWLGKVLINVFVHDELLMEVHESIDLRYFLKAWREEFQLEIDGFCKLYAGAGFGNSWYEAKKKDYPPQYIDTLIKDYDANPNSPWHGDGQRHLKELDAGFEQYKINRVQDFIYSPEHKGEIVKPLINSLLVEVSGNIIKEAQSSPALLDRYNGVLGRLAIPKEGKAELKAFEDFAAIFSEKYGHDPATITVVAPDAKLTTTDLSESQQEEEEDLSYMDAKFTIGDRLDISHYFVDYEERRLYLDHMEVTQDSIPTTSIDYLFSRGIFKQEGLYKVFYRDVKSQYGKQLIETTLYVTSEGLRTVEDSYAGWSNFWAFRAFGS